MDISIVVDPSGLSTNMMSKAQSYKTQGALASQTCQTNKQVYISSDVINILK